MSNRHAGFVAHRRLTTLSLGGFALLLCGLAGHLAATGTGTDPPPEVVFIVGWAPLSREFLAFVAGQHLGGPPTSAKENLHQGSIGPKHK